ncbi:SGNH/GDSL hydrolase family protein [Mycoplasmopsis verecunda]|uniref:GDSL-like Lipase/Acylhydrolase n=1 Tax=Mycoplasmopsis verecunda TaxID=171291 RepID=A0A1T4KKA4_9BACT|nr:SGNH/GDSL hydrolase family protein [Mycoplasmopsis verecunda]WPB54261.1 GDSL-type esterase/lipase family protein [Mycoplasmopsis verecunda]SJZ42849.1 GDSL-like Lipase/Acylhydrolase [Mycoplasmopsis verecunda]
MKKNKLLVSTGLLAFIGASALLSASCKAPGSSPAISSSDPLNHHLTKPGSINPIKPKEPSKILPGDKPIELPLPVQGDDVITLRAKSPNFIAKDQKIKYVALGDSITAGFDGGLLQDYPGSLKDGKIEGASYPAFLSQLLNQDGRVESFQNFAASGSRAIDWIKMFDAQYQNPFSDEPSWDKLDHTFAGRLGFGKFKSGYAQEIAQQSKQALADANLVTFSLGANDFFFLLIKHVSQNKPMEIINELKKPHPDYLKIYKFVHDALDLTIPELANRVQVLAEKIAELAPKANINIVMYPMPMSGIKKALDDFIRNLVKADLPIDPVVLLLEQINLPYKQIASAFTQKYGKDNRISVVNAYNPTYWSAHSADLSDVYFDIHPNTYGYKKLAMDMYLKLTNPSILLKNYDPNFDFTQDFLETDATILKYQIEVDKTPAEVIGANTKQYLDNNDAFLTEINKTRSPYNYGERVLRMSQTFKNISTEVIQAVTNTSIYKELDPEGKLTNVILDPENDGANGFGSIVQEIINEKILQKIIGDFQAELTEKNKKGELVLTDIPKILIKHVINEENLFKLINALAKSKFINHNKERLSDGITTVINNLFKKFQDTIANGIVSALNTNLEKFGINPGDVKLLLIDIINSSNLNNILNALVTTFIRQSERFQTVSNYPELVKAFISDDEMIEKLSNSLSDFVWTTLNNPALKSALRKIAWEQITKHHLDHNLTEQGSDKLVDSVLDNVINFRGEKTDKFISDFIKFFFLNMRETEFNKLDIALVNALNQAFNTLVTDGDGISLSPLKVIDIFADTKIISNNVAFIKQLVQNIIDQAPNLNLADVIVKLLPPSVSQYVPADGVKILFNILVSNENSRAILREILNGVIDSFDTFQGSKDFGELFQKLLKSINLDTIKTNVTSLANDLLTQDTIKDTIITLLRKILENLKEQTRITDSEISSFLTDFKAEAFPIIKQLNTLNPIIDKLFELLEAIKNSTNPLVDFNKLPSELIEVAKKAVFTDPWSLINKVLDSNLITHNKEFVKKLAKFFIIQANQDNALIKQIKSLLINAISAAKLDDLIDKDEVITVLGKILDNQQTTKLLPIAIDFLVDNLDIVKLAQNPKELVAKLLQNKAFKQILNQNIKPILINLTSDLQINKTLAKVIRKLATDNWINIEDNYLPVFNKLVSHTWNNVLWNKQGAINVINAVVDFVADNNYNLEELIAKLPSVVLSNINIDAFLLTKGLFTLPLEKNEYKLYKEFLDSLLNQLQTLARNKDTFVSRLVEKIPVPSQIAKYQVTAQEIQVLALRILQSDSLNKFGKSFTQFVIDNQDKFKQAQNWSDFVLIPLSDVEFIKTIKPIAVSAINKAKNQSEFGVIKKTLVAYGNEYLLNNESISWLFKSKSSPDAAKLKELLSSLYDLVMQYETELNIIDTLFVGLEEFAKDGNATTFEALGQKVIAEFKKLFDKQHLETNIIKLLHLFGKTLISKHGSYIEEIIQNLYNKLATDEKFVKQIYEVIPLKTRDNIAKYITYEQINDFVKFLLNNKDFKDVFNKELKIVLSTLNEFKAINSFEDLLKVVIKKIDFDSIHQQIQNFIQATLNDAAIKQHIKDVTINIIKRQFRDIYVNQKAQGSELNYTEQFVSDVIDNILPLGKDLDLYNPILSYIFTALNKAKESENIIEFVKTIPNEILNIVKSKFNNNPKEFIIKVLDSPIIVNNKEYLKVVAKALLNKYIATPAVKNLISNLIDSKSKEIEKYANTEHIKSLILDIVQNANTANLISKAIDSVLSIQDLKSLVNNPLNTIFNVLKSSEILNSNNEIVALIKLALQHNAISDLLQTYVNKYLINQGFLTDENKLPIGFFDAIRKSLNDFIFDNPKFLSQIISLAKESILASNNFAEFANKFAAKIPSLFNLSDYSLVKLLLNSNIWNYKEQLLAIVDKLFDKHNGLYDSILPKLQTLIPVDKLANALQIQNKEQVSNVINQIISSSDFKAIAHESLKAIVNSVNNDNNELSLAKADSYNDLVKALVKNNTYVRTIKPYVINLVNIGIKESGLLEIIQKVISQALQKEDLAFIFNGISSEELQSLIKNIIGIYDVIDKNFGVSDLIFETLISHIRVNGTNFTKLNIFGVLKSLFTDNANNPEFEAKVAKTLASIASSELFTTNKPQISKILDNVFGNLSKSEDLSSVPEWVQRYGTNGPRKAIELANSIIKLIPQGTRDKIFNNVTQSNFEKILVFILTNNNFQTAVTQGVRNVVENINQYSSVTSYADIIKTTVSMVDLDTLKQSIIGFSNDLLSNSTLKDLLEDTIYRALRNIGVNVDSYSEAKKAAIKALSQNAKAIVDNLELLTPIIEIIFNGIKTASAQENQEQLLASLSLIPQQIAKLVDTNVKANPKKFISRMLNIQFVKNNYTSYIEIVQDVFYALRNSGQLQELVSNLINSLGNNAVFNYISKDNLVSLINLIIGKVSKNGDTVSVDKPSDFDTLLNTYLDEIKKPEFFNQLHVENISTYQPIKFISIINDNEALRNTFTKNISSIIDRVIKSNEFSDVVTDVTNNLAKIFRIDLGDVDRTKLTKELMTDLVSYLHNTHILESTIQNILLSILEVSQSEHQDKGFREKLQLALELFGQEMKKLINFKKYKYVQAIFENAHSLVTNKTDLIKVVDVIYDDISQRDEVINKIITVSGLGNILDKFDISYQVANLENNPLDTSGEAIELIKEILNLPDAKNTLHIVLQHVLEQNNWAKYEAIKVTTDDNDSESSAADKEAYSKLIKVLVSDNEFKQSLISSIRKWIYQINKSDNFAKVLAKIAHKVIINIDFDKMKATLPGIPLADGELATSAPDITTFPIKDLFKGISNPEALITTLIKNFNEIDAALDLIPQLFEGLIETVSQNGIDTNGSKIASKLLSVLKEIAFKPNFQAKLIQAMKSNINYVNEHKLNNDVKSFFTNLTKFVTSNISFGSLIWKAVPKEANWMKQLIEKLQLSENDLVGLGVNFIYLIDQFVNHPKVPELINKLSEWYLANPNEIDGVNDIYTGLKKFLNVYDNSQFITQNITELAKSIFNDNKYARTIAHFIVNKSLKFLGLDYSNDAESKARLDKIVDLFVNNTGTLLDETETFKSIFTSIVDTIKKTNNLDEFLSQVSGAIFKGLGFTEFATAKKFLKTSIIKDNKNDIFTIVSELIDKIFNTGIQGEKGKIKELIYTFNVSSILMKALVPAERLNTIDSSKKQSIINNINAMLVEAIGQPSLAKLLTTLLKDIFDRIDVYTNDNHTSYSSMLNELFKSPSERDIKASIKEWFTLILANTDNIISNGAAEILQSMLMKSGFNFNTGDDLKIIQEIIAGLMKTLASTTELEEIIDGIYKTIQATNFEQSSNTSKDLTNAIIKGILSVITTPDGRDISLIKILNKNVFLQKLLINIQPVTYVKFINRLFESSSLEKNTGMYAALKSILDIPIPGQENKPNNNASQPAVDDGKQLQNEIKLGFKFDVSIFDVVGKFKGLIKEIFYPMFVYQLQQVSDGKIDPDGKEYYRSEGFKAMFRMSGMLLSIIKHKVNSNSLFWGYSPVTIERMVNDGTGDAYLAMMSKFNAQYSKLNYNQKKAIGSDGGRGYNKEYVFGNTSNGTSASNYWTDQLLAYIYWGNDTNIDRHNKPTKILDIYFKALENGYLKPHGWNFKNK